VLDTASDLAKFLNVSTASVRRWERETDMPRVRIGRVVRFDRSAVLAWQHANQQRNNEKLGPQRANGRNCG
jgi:excisionase family DNA binding protein